MTDIFQWFHANGIPSWVLLLAFSSYEGLKQWMRRRPTKSEREILSADELTFRKALMEQMSVQGAELERQRTATANCLAAHAECLGTVQAMMDQIRSAGLEFLMKITPVAPMPGDKHD